MQSKMTATVVPPSSSFNMSPPWRARAFVLATLCFVLLLLLKFFVPSSSFNLVGGTRLTSYLSERVSTFNAENSLADLDDKPSLIQSSTEEINMGDKSWLDVVCKKHKKIVSVVAQEIGFPKNIIKVLSCERLKRSISDWFNSSVSAFNQLYRLSKFIERLDDQKLGKIAVIGGSVEMGVSDFYQVGGRQHAWPAKLESLMKKVWPGVIIDNLSHGGYSLEQHLRVFDRYTKKGYGFYLLSFATNDQVDLNMVAEQKKLLPKISSKFYQLVLGQPNYPAVMNIETLRSGLRSKADTNQHCPGKVREFPNDVFFCDQWWYPQTWRTPARRKFGIPIVSYRDAIFPDLKNPPSDLNTTWSGRSHPGPRVHFWVAESLFYSMLVLRESINAHKGAIKQDDTMCINKKTACDANEGKQNFPVFKSGCGWKFREDVKGKPGWIIESGKSIPKGCNFEDNRELKISFKVSIGKVGLITGSYLVSYDERMGRARVWVNDKVNDAIVLNSRIESKVSIPRGFEIRVGEKLRNKQVIVNVQLIVSFHEKEKVNKFKLLTLDSC